MGMFTEIHQDTDGRSAGMPEALGHATSGGGRMWVRVVEEEKAVEKRRRERSTCHTRRRKWPRRPAETELQCEVSSSRGQGGVCEQGERPGK